MTEKKIEAHYKFSVSACMDSCDDFPSYKHPHGLLSGIVIDETGMNVFCKIPYGTIADGHSIVDALWILEVVLFESMIEEMHNMVDGQGELEDGDDSKERRRSIETFMASTISEAVIHAEAALRRSHGVAIAHCVESGKPVILVRLPEGTPHAFLQIEDAKDFLVERSNDGFITEDDKNGYFLSLDEKVCELPRERRVFSPCDVMVVATSVKNHYVIVTDKKGCAETFKSKHIAKDFVFMSCMEGGRIPWSRHEEMVDKINGLLWIESDPLMETPEIVFPFGYRVRPVWRDGVFLGICGLPEWLNLLFPSNSGGCNEQGEVETEVVSTENEDKATTVSSSSEPCLEGLDEETRRKVN